MTDILQRNSGGGLIESLLQRLESISKGGPQGGGGYELAGAGGPNVTYAPVYNLYGSATAEDVKEADKMSREEFARMMKQWQRDNDRTKF